MIRGVNRLRPSVGTARQLHRSCCGRAALSWSLGEIQEWRFGNGGADPAAERVEEKQAVAAARAALIVGDLLDTFIKHHEALIASNDKDRLSEKAVTEYKRLATKILKPDLGAPKIDELKPDAVKAMYRDRRAKPTQAAPSVTRATSLGSNGIAYAGRKSGVQTFSAVPWGRFSEDDEENNEDCDAFENEPLFDRRQCALLNRRFGDGPGGGRLPDSDYSDGE